ncbi:MAG TPA: GAF domain-containing protein, partial [Longimicrobiaceae bacterium]|nr:GAF domain-containing protein [Longimicrobiaceae bacterium]
MPALSRPAILIGAALVLAGLAAWLLSRDRSDAAALASAWPPLHLAILLTGSLASPLTPFAAVWTALLGRRASRFAIPAAVAAFVLSIGAHWMRTGRPGTGDAARFALLLAVGVALTFARAKPVKAAEEMDEEPDDRPPPAVPDDGETDEGALLRSLELLRHATDAHEAALWRMDPSGRTASLVGWRCVPGHESPPPVVDLEGHPFGWAMQEEMPVHLQRGKRALPSHWAAEMLLIPADVPQGVLALAYPGVVPPGVEPVALDASKSLGTLLSLLSTRAEAGRDAVRTQALLAAVQALPGELELDRFAEQLADSVCRVAGAAGAAVALAGLDGTDARVVHVTVLEGRQPRIPPVLGDGDSRVALAMKHGVDLAYADLRRERDRTPLFAPREEWETQPRSAVILPLMDEGRTLGAVVAWHPEPGRFGERETELLR